MGIIKNILGNRYRKLLVIKQTKERMDQKVVWLCKCDCGNLTKVRSSFLIRNLTGSCGCLVKETKNTTHNMSNTPIYAVWHTMISRCKSPKHNRYHIYGGRGIAVCKRWLNFINF